MISNAQRKIDYTERVVAFIDVLGFGRLVNKSALNNEDQTDALNKLNKLIHILERSIPTLDSMVSKSVPEEVIPRHIYISDSIILSAPKLLDHDGYRYYGLISIIMRSIQLTHLFINEGYLIRGGIDIGLAYHEDGNIVGPAYQEAYHIENEVAEFPRILLSEKAEKEWNNLNFNQNMCIERDGRLMVNGLFPHKNYIEEEYRTLYFESYYKRIQKIIDHNLSELERWTEERSENQYEKQAAKDKWAWFRKYTDEIKID